MYELALKEGIVSERELEAMKGSLSKSSETSLQPPSKVFKKGRNDDNPDEDSGDGAAGGSNDKGSKGGQSGHTGWFRKFSSSPDETRDYYPVECGGCGATFDKDALVELVKEYEMEELVDKPIKTIRHRKFACLCGKCLTSTEAEMSVEVTNFTYGLKL